MIWTGVGVGVGVSVAVIDGVKVGDGVALGDGVSVMEGAAVGVSVAVGEGVTVASGVAVWVAVGGNVGGTKRVGSGAESSPWQAAITSSRPGSIAMRRIVFSAFITRLILHRGALIGYKNRDFTAEGAEGAEISRDKEALGYSPGRERTAGP
jgi:hypothetical protein